MFYAVVVFHVATCVALVLVVLMQASKGEGLAGSAFGGGGISGAVFGGRGAATFLSKATKYLAILFMVNCLALALMSATTTGGGAADGTGRSAISTQAQQERDAVQQQQQAVPPPVDTSGAAVNPLENIPNTPSGDTSGN